MIHYRNLYDIFYPKKHSFHDIGEIIEFKNNLKLLRNSAKLYFATE